MEVLQLKFGELKRASGLPQYSLPDAWFSSCAALLSAVWVMMAMEVTWAGTDITWTNGVVGNNRQWGTAANWSPNTVPNTTAYNAVFTDQASALTNSFTLNETTYTLTGVTPSNGSYVLGRLNFAGKPPGNDGWYLDCNSGANALLTVNGDGGVNPVIATAPACTAALVTSQSLRIALGLNGENEIQVNGPLLVIQATIVNGGGAIASLNKTGSGLLTLTSAESYTGNTTISAGTLQLAGGSISASPLIFIAAGATLDVSSALYTLSGITTLSASGNGTSVGVNAAAIKGKSGTLVGLGAQPITLTYDGSHPALYLSQGTLSLNGNLFVVNTPGPLAAGTYTLVQQAVGNIIAFAPPTVAGTAIGPGKVGRISISGGRVVLNVIAAATISLETAADGSGAVVPPQSVVAGSTVTVYAIARTSDGSFLANVPASWTFAATNAGVAGSDLVASGDGKSATFTGHLAGVASIRAAWGGLTSATPMVPLLSSARMRGLADFALAGSGSPSQAYDILANTNLTAPISNWWAVGSTHASPDGAINFMDLKAANSQQFYCLAASPATDSGSLTVVPGTATQVRVETAPDGSGTVPARTFASGDALTVYAVTRDPWGNFVANAAADSWTIANATGGITASDLSPASGKTSTFTGQAVGSGQIRASLSGMIAVDSGLITVIPAATMSWSATPANFHWDTTSANWVGGSGVFIAGDSVLFTDGGSASSPIVLAGTLTPASVTVDISTNHYTWSGSGKLSGSGSLVKSGSGTLTFANTTPNTYTGETFVRGGTLKVTTATGFGLANPSPITVASGATLFLNVGGITTWSNNVSGAGLWQVGTGTGSQTTTLGGDYGAFTGTLEVAAGGAKIVFPAAARFPSAKATVQLDANLTAYINVGGTFPSAIRMYGGTTGEALGQLRLFNGLTISGPVTLLAATTIGVDSGRTATISGAISGGFGFTKLSAGTLTLSGGNTYTGNTRVNAGTLLVNGTLGHAASTMTVTGGTGVLGGRGVILSRVHILSDGALAPGVTGPGTLTISNDLTLAGRTMMEVDRVAHTNDVVVAVGKLTFGGTLMVSNLASTFQMGDSFTLFQAGSYAGAFTAVSPASPGPGLVWDLSSLAVDGTLLVMGTQVTEDSYSYAGYNIKASSRFNAYNSLVNRPYPLYDYSVNVLKIGSSYLAVTGNRYTGSGEDGDHIFAWTSPAGQPGTWTNIKGAGSSAPLFLQKDSFGANTMDPELICNPANNTWYLYVQKQRSAGDQIMVLTSPDRTTWTPFASRPVIVNTPTNRIFFHHQEVLYVSWSSTPFWLYVYLQVDGVNKGYKLLQSDDPLTFDYNAQIDSRGEINLGGQRGYLPEAKNGPVFVRTTQTGGLPILQFSTNGTSWTGSGGHVVLAGSNDTGKYKNCYFPGISTINGNGALEYLGHNRWRAIYAATTCASPTAPDIWHSEIGCGELVLDLN